MKGKMNYWTEKEKGILEKNTRTYSSVREACTATSKTIKRSYDAVYFKYLTHIKGIRKNHYVKKKSGQPKVTYFNGSTKNGEVLVNTKELLVVRVDNAVITVQYK